VTATATCTVGVATFAVAAGGTGYTVGNVLTVVGGTGTAATFTVATLSGSAVATVTSTNAGSYSAVPTNPVSTTGGTGTGCTININTYAVTSGGFTITNAGSGYVEQPTVTFSGGGGSGAAAYASVGAGSVIRSLGSTGTQSLDFYTPSGITGSVPTLRLRDGSAGQNSSLRVQGGVDSVNITSTGTASTLLNISVEASTSIRFKTNSSTEILRIIHANNGVNRIEMTGAATGGSPAITAQGSDTNVTLLFSSKGTNDIQFRTNSSSQVQFQVLHTTSAVNRLTVTGSIAGAAPVLASAGSDTNIDLALTPKGTGNVRFGTYTADMTLIVQGYVEIKDSGGTIRKLAVIA
jgi:hypothetical protein